jgi:hypothetical protein
MTLNVATPRSPADRVARALRSLAAAAQGLVVDPGADGDAVLRRAVDFLTSDLDATQAEIWLRDPARNMFRLHVHAGAGAEVPASEFAGPVGRAAWVRTVATTGAPHVRRGLDVELAGGREALAVESASALAAFPLTAAGELAGVLVYEAVGPLDPELVDVLGTFAALVAAQWNEANLVRCREEARDTAHRLLDHRHRY